MLLSIIIVVSRFLMPRKWISFPSDCSVFGSCFMTRKQTSPRGLCSRSRNLRINYPYSYERYWRIWSHQKHFLSRISSGSSILRWHTCRRSVLQTSTKFYIYSDQSSESRLQFATLSNSGRGRESENKDSLLETYLSPNEFNVSTSTRCGYRIVVPNRLTLRIAVSIDTAPRFNGL